MSVISLKRAVGSGTANPDPHDVETIQTALAAIKAHQKNGYRPIYQGKIDGKQTPALIGAITLFQRRENLLPTGKVEASGATLSRLRQKAHTPMLQQVVTPPAFTGGGVQEAVGALMQMASDAESLADAIITNASAAKGALRFDSDGDGKPDNRLFRLLRRFDRWFDVMDGRVSGKGGPIDGLPERLLAIAGRARKLAAIPGDERWPIYDLRDARTLKIPGRHDYVVKEGVPVHTVKPDLPTSSCTYIAKDSELLARLSGSWLAVLFGYDRLSEALKPAVLAHEFVHALNHNEGLRIGDNPAVPSHYATTGIDFTKPVNKELDRQRVLYNPSSWGAYIANKEFERRPNRQ